MPPGRLTNTRRLMVTPKGQELGIIPPKLTRLKRYRMPANGMDRLLPPRG
jgi:hypothetical protein